MAAEGGPIRGGEHDGFTRLVMQVDPKTEWSLETGGGRAVIRFPGKPLDFATGGAFDRIPRGRIRSVTANGETGAGTRSCSSSGATAGSPRASSARATSRSTSSTPAGRARSGAGGTPPRRRPRPEAPARETSAVRSAEGLLVEQIERAAGQGLVQLTLRSAAARGWRPRHRRHWRGRQDPAADRPSPTGGRGRRFHASTRGLAALAEEDQIEATSVYDRDDAIEMRPEGAGGAQAVSLPEGCSS